MIVSLFAQGGAQVLRRGHSAADTRNRMLARS